MRPAPTGTVPPTGSETASDRETLIARLAAAIDPVIADWSPDAVLFHDAHDPNGILTNTHPTMMHDDDGMLWGSPEAFYQGLKFPHDGAIRRRIAYTGDAIHAKTIAREAATPRRADWHAVRLPSMIRTVLLRADQDPAYVMALLATEARDIVEFDPRGAAHAFWGAARVGRRVVGSNAMGRVHMALRDHIQGNPRQ